MRYLAATAAILAALTVSPALADRGKSKGKGWNNQFHTQAFCPPGLAKKNPPCVPPGLARGRGWDDDDDDDWDDHHVHVIRVGDYIDDRFVYIPDPYRYGLDPNYFYYRALDRVFRVDPQTRQVLALIGLVDALLN